MRLSELYIKTNCHCHLNSNERSIISQNVKFQLNIQDPMLIREIEKRLPTYNPENRKVLHRLKMTEGMDAWIHLK